MLMRLVFHLNKNKEHTEAIKDIIDIANDELKLPKKIIKRMGKNTIQKFFSV